MRKVFLLLILWLQIATTSALAATQDYVAERAYFEDTSNALTWSEVKDKSFTPFSGMLSKGYSKSAFWVRLKISPVAKQAIAKQDDASSLVLKIQPTYLDEIRLYDPAEPLKLNRALGDRYPYVNNERHSLTYDFLIPTSSEPRYVWLRLKTTSTNLMQISVVKEADALKIDRLLETVSTAIFSALIIFLIWALIYWWMTRERLIGIFLIRQLLGIAFFAAYMGYFRILFSEVVAPSVLDSTMSFFVLSSTAAAFWFHREFFKDYLINRWWQRAFIAAIWLFPVEMFLFVTGSLVTALKINMVVVMLGPVVMLLICIFAIPWARLVDSVSVLPRRYLILAHAMYLLVTSLTALPSLGLASGGILSPHAALFHAFVTAVVLVMVILYRAKRMEKQRISEVIVAEQAALSEKANPVTGQPQSAFNGTPVSSNYTSPALDAYTVRAGGRYLVQDNWSVGAEIGHDYGFETNPTWAALSTDYRYAKGRAFARVETPTGRATAGADYRVLDDTSVYGRWEQTNGLASSYALDSAAKSQAMLVGVRNADMKGTENYSEMRMREGMNQTDLESATGMRNTVPINDHLKANVMAERLKIFHGGGRSATALGGGFEYIESLWQGTFRLEWRQMDKDPSSATDNTATSWMNTISLARKIDDNWTGLLKNYLLTTDDRSVAGSQLQNRFQLGGAYRPLWTNDFDALLRYENKYENNSELTSGEHRFVNLISVNGNYHPSRPWWLNGRIAGKTVNETLAGVSDSYQAYLFSGRIIRDLNKDFDIGLMGSMMYSPQGNAMQYAYGAELGYLVQQNVWASAGYNFSGFTDRDLTGSDYTMQGLYVRLRMKFDEKDIQKHTKIFRSADDVPFEGDVPGNHM